MHISNRVPVLRVLHQILPFNKSVYSSDTDDIFSSPLHYAVYIRDHDGTNMARYKMDEGQVNNTLFSGEDVHRHAST